MKYRVVGWTWFEDPQIPCSEIRSTAEWSAIVDEIRKHKYLFTGMQHQEWDGCTPVLNDGKKRLCSHREWGALMADAYGDTDRMAYSYYAFGYFDKEDANIPEESFLQDFIPEEIENEHFEVEVGPEVFARSERKKIIFMNDLDALRYLGRGYTLTLTCGDRRASYLVEDLGRWKYTRRRDLAYTYELETPYKLAIKRKKLPRAEQK